MCHHELQSPRLSVQCSAYCAVRSQYAADTANCAALRTVADGACEAVCIEQCRLTWVVTVNGVTGVQRAALHSSNTGTRLGPHHTSPAFCTCRHQPFHCLIRRKERKLKTTRSGVQDREAGGGPELGPHLSWLLTAQAHTPANLATDTTGSIADPLDALRGELLGCSKASLDSDAAGLSRHEMWCLCLRTADDPCFSTHV